MHIVFVATELGPVLPGGAGALIADVGGRLQTAGHRVEAIVVADRPADAPDPSLPVTWVDPGEPDREAPGRWQALSRAAAQAIAGLSERPDLVEFQDFFGLGMWSLMRRVSLGLSDIPLTVRMHGPIDLVYERVGLLPDAEPVLRTMETEAFRMADGVVVASAGMAGLVVDRYGVEPGRVRVGTPPVPVISRGVRAPSPTPEIVAYGRLGEEKGSEDLVAAVIPLLDEYPDLVVRFVGPNGWRIRTGASLRDELAAGIPSAMRERVRFEPPIKRSELAQVMETAWAAVFPSRFESFCLAAHETRSIGIPVLVPQRPEFEEFFSASTGALVYGTSVTDLRAALREVIEHGELRSALEDAAPPTYGEPLAPYRPVVPRHPRTQAGLATAALKRLRAAETPRQPAAEPTTMERALGWLPEPAARWVESRDIDSPAVRRWRRHRSAHAWQRRWMRHLWGTHPPVSDPTVSVVIPCFNQGPFLHDAIRSVFRQAYDSWEIIVVDDGSTEPSTTEILRTLHYPRTRLIRQRNRGLPAARNAGIAAARGRYVVPLDADDELGLAFLTATVDALAANPHAAFAHTWTRLFGNQNLVWVDRPYNPYQLLLSTSIVGCVLIRADALRQVGGYDERRRQGNEDWDLWVRFLEAGWGQVEVPRPLFRYRQHGISMSVTTEARFEDARLEMAEAHPALYDREALAALKAEFYPWVSVLVDDSAPRDLLAAQSLDDLEIVVIGSSQAWSSLGTERGWRCRPGGPDLSSALGSARGKFLIDWRPVTEAGPDLLEELASVLEDDPDAYASAVEAGRHPVLWRRWSLLDPRAEPHRLAKAGTRGAGPPVAESDWLGAFPDERWAIDPGHFAVPLQRVRPEVEGRFPTWLP